MWNTIWFWFLDLPIWARILIVLVIIGILLSIYEKITEPMREKQRLEKELEVLRGKYGNDENVKNIKAMWEKIRRLNDKNLILTISLGGKENIKEIREDTSSEYTLNIVVWDAEKVRMDYMEAVYKLESIEYGVVKLRLPYGESSKTIAKSLKDFLGTKAAEIGVLSF
jgi:predicted transcriptional regulator YdeE